MQNNFGGRLRNQLIFAFMAIITVLMVLVSSLTYKRVKAVVQKLSADTTQQYLGQNEYNITVFAEEIDGVLRLLSQLEEVKAYMQTGWQNDFSVIMNANDILAETNRLIKNYEYVESVFYYGDNGVVLGCNRRENIVVQGRDKRQYFYESPICSEAEKNPWETLWFGNFSSDDFVGSDSMMEDEAVPYITAARSINVVGRHVATVVVNMKETVLADMIGRADEAHRRESFLVDNEGYIIVHRDKSRLGSRFALDAEPEKADEYYFMNDDVQVNYRRIRNGQNMPWTLLCEVPVSVLYADIYSLRQWFVGAVAVALVVAWSMSMYWMYRLTRPLDELRKAMLSLEHGNLGGQLKDDSQNELGMLGKQFNQMSQSIEELVTQIQEVESEKRLLEKEALQAQINPHFLFNTLSNIKYMAMIVHAGSIVECITALGNFLAPVYKSGNDVWTVEDEVAYIQNYVKIMNYRFGGQIKVDYEYDETVSRLAIMKFILQPIVENAISHGFDEREGMGKIVIRFNREELLTICVEDNGSGLDQEELSALQERLAAWGKGTSRQKGHIGLGNVHRRLKVHYGEDYGLTIDSRKGAGTTVCIRLPITAEESRMEAAKTETSKMEA